jgi:hypothetical protein
MSVCTAAHSRMADVPGPDATLMRSQARWILLALESVLAVAGRQPCATASVWPADAAQGRERAELDDLSAEAHPSHFHRRANIRRYTGDRRSLKPFGPYNARYTGDHRQFFRSGYAEMITRVSLDLVGLITSVPSR